MPPGKADACRTSVDGRHQPGVKCREVELRAQIRDPVELIERELTRTTLSTWSRHDRKCRASCGNGQVRHDETFCTGAHRNGPKRTEAREVKTGTKQNGPKRTGIQTPLSGPRYRGSNPCLPANKPITINHLQPATAVLAIVRTTTFLGHGVNGRNPVLSEHCTCDHKNGWRPETDLSRFVSRRAVKSPSSIAA